MKYFSEKLYSSLISKGVPKSEADDLICKLNDTFEFSSPPGPEDEEDIEAIASHTAMIILRRLYGSSAEADDMDFSDPIMPAEIIHEKRGVPDTEYFRKLSKCSPRRKKLESHIYPFLLTLAKYLIIFVDVLATLMAIAIMISVTVIGVILFFTGLFYGISQFSVFRGAALYECGIGLLSAGISAILVILFYNLITVLLPNTVKPILGTFKDIRGRFKRFRFALKNGGGKI